MTAYITIMLVVALVVLPLYAVGRWLFVRRQTVRPKKLREAALALFFLFCCGLFSLLFLFLPPQSYSPDAMLQYAAGRLSTGEGINLMPMYTVGTYLKTIDRWGSYGWGLFAVNIIGNIIMFVPIGLGLPLLWRRWQRWWKMLLLAFALPLGVELVQLFLPRSVDVDDVLLNACGILLGWGLCCLVRRSAALVALAAEPRPKKADKRQPAA